MLLDVVDIKKVYATGDRETTAIDDISFSLGELEFLSVVGPSGCGKTTLLKCMSGLIEPTSGQTTLRGEPVIEPLPEMAIVFQDYSRSLLPWLTVRSNITLPLRRRTSAAERDAIADRAIEAVGLSRFAEHYPSQLSGGMQQRVAIARALAYEPKVLLLDEPFASVDAQTRVALEDLVLALRRDFEISTLLVTHDIDEAVYMSDRVVVLTRQPSTVLETLDVDLPWPRDQIETKAMARFSELRAHVYREVSAAHGDAAERSAQRLSTGN